MHTVVVIIFIIVLVLLIAGVFSEWGHNDQGRQ